MAEHAEAAPSAVPLQIPQSLLMFWTPPGTSGCVSPPRLDAIPVAVLPNVLRLMQMLLSSLSSVRLCALAFSLSKPAQDVAGERIPI